MTETPLGIGIDTGGTFTDIVLFRFEDQTILRKGKTPTTHGNYAVCISKAFQALQLTEKERQALTRVSLSTTLATNTVAEKKIHPTALIVEPGDISVPGDLHEKMILLKSRISFDTMEVVPVSEREVLEATAPIADQVESFAVSGYASTRSPAHEQQIAEILRRAYNKPVVLGSELTHQLNFMQRARAAALNAGLLPVIMEWLEAVKSILKEIGVTCSLYIVKGDGSLMEESEALERPVQTLFSGPAASLHGGWFLSGEPEAVVVDVGGTTTDIGRVFGGRGRLRPGGIRINHQQIAVDGMDMFTHGLGGDSRFRLGTHGRYMFENKRVLPFCRAAELYPQFSMDDLEKQMEDQWHFGDPALLDLVALDNLRMGGNAKGANILQNGGRELTAREMLVVEQVQQGPKRVRAVAKEAGIDQPISVIDELDRQRVLVRIGVTPTDFFCAQGQVPGFSEQAAKQAIGFYARMLDHSMEEFQQALKEAVERQTTGLMLLFMAEFEPPLEAEDPAVERLVELLWAQPNQSNPTLALDPNIPIVLVGAGGPMLFASLPGALGDRVVVHEHGDVANAVGAVTSRFLLRETVSVEPLPREKGVEVFDHTGKTSFPTLEEGMAHGRSLLKAKLTHRAQELGLEETHLELNEEVIEEYADFSQRKRKELVIARIEAILTGIPGTKTGSTTGTTT